MIQSVSTAEDKTEYLRRIAHKPYFESTLGTHLHLFGNHPASGWAFYLLPGSAVLELRGGSAVLCGALPGGEAGEDAREELMGFLRFLHADTLRDLMRCHESRDILTVCELAIQATMERKETGRCVYKLRDYPELNPDMAKPLLLIRGEDGPRFQWGKAPLL